MSATINNKQPFFPTQQITQTHSLSIWVSLFIFSKTTYPVAHLPPPQKMSFWGRGNHLIYLFFPFQVIILDLKPRLLTRNAAKKYPYVQTEGLWAQCVIITTVFEVNTKKMKEGKLVHLAGRRGKGSRGAKGLCKVLKLQQTCSWVYILFRKTHIRQWCVGHLLTLRKKRGRLNTSWNKLIFSLKSILELL